MLLGVRERLIARRTQLSNMIRGHAAEFGLVVAKGTDKLAALLAAIREDASLPELARDLFKLLEREYEQSQVELQAVEAKLKAWHRADAMSRRLAQVPGIGPVTAAALVMKAPDPHAFRSGRLFAAWLGLTPKDHSTGGKLRLGKITRAGDEVLRSLLVVGATSVVKVAKGPKKRGPRWLIELLKRKSPKLAAVAFANKMARIAWKLMTTGERYDSTKFSAVSPAA
jgi:transposase